MAASGTSGVTTKIRTKEDAEKQTEQFFQKHDNVFEPILDIIEPSPGIDQDIIALFNRKFNASYPNVSKPIICNGLQEVKVYHDSVSMGGEEESAAENAIP